MQVDSKIEGAFTGTSNEVVFKLINGQVWQQVGYRYKYTYRYRPRVTIARDGGNFFMNVEGFSDQIRVRRLV